MQLFKRIPSEKLLGVAFIAIYLQILLASNDIIKPISMMRDTTLFYLIVFTSVIIFPIWLTIIFNHYLGKRSWVDRKSLLITFLVSYFGIFTLVLLVNLGLHSSVLPHGFGPLYICLEEPITLFALIGVPLAKMLGWHGWSMFQIAFITGVIILSFVLALAVSICVNLTVKKRKPIYLILLTISLYSWIFYGVYMISIS